MESEPTKKPPGRPRTDPSGRKTPVSVTLSPKHLGLLDAAATRHNITRSEVVARLLERSAPKP